MPLPIEEIVDLALGVCELLKFRSAPPPLGGGGEGGLNGFKGEAPFGYGGIIASLRPDGKEAGELSKSRRRTGGVGGDLVPKGSPL